MHISPINTTQPNFRARFSSTQIEKLTEKALKADPYNGVPKLYTLLEILDKYPGNIAEITSQKYVSPYFINGQYPTSIWYSLKIDGKYIKDGSNCEYKLLEESLTGVNQSISAVEFYNRYNANKSKTIADLKKYALI